MRNHRSFLFGKHQRDGNVFDAGVVAAGEFGNAGDLQVSMFRRVGFCPGGELFQRLRDPEPVLVGLDGIAPGDLQLAEFMAVPEDVGAGFGQAAGFRDLALRLQRPVLFRIRTAGVR